MPTIEQIREAAEVLDKMANENDLAHEAGVRETFFFAHAGKLRKIADYLEEQQAKPKIEVVVDDNEDTAEAATVRIKFGDRQVAVYISDSYQNGVYINDTLSAEIGEGTVVWSNK